MNAILRKTLAAKAALSTLLLGLPPVQLTRNLFGLSIHRASLALALMTLLPATTSRADVLSLDGNGDYVTFPGTGIPSGNAPFTIEAWINPTSIPTGGENGGQMTFWGNESANQANGFRLRGSAGVRHFFWGNDHDENLGVDTLPNTTGPNADGWHHLALVWNGSQTRWYFNGVAIGNPRTAAGVNVAAVNHRIGSRPGGEFFHGFMDEIRIWSVARSATDIATDFRRELNGDEAGLVAYWNFEGGLTDRAGGNNNGTALGNATTVEGLNAPVLPVGPRVFEFAVTPGQIYLAQSATLSWAVSNATSVVIDQGIGAVSPTNSLLITPTATTTYTLTATNANGTRTALATVVVDPGVPLAVNLITNTAYNTPVNLTLRGSDPQGSNLTYSIVLGPTHGSLSGVPPNVIYTPTQDFGGSDSFTYKVNDGTFDSAPATVSLSVIPPALPPTGIALSSTNIASTAGPGAFVAALQAVDVNNLFGDSHTFGFAAGGVNNEQFDLNSNVLSTSPLYSGGPGATFSLRLRATDSTGLSYTQNVSLAVQDVLRSVVINEFHYNPAYNPSRESFIELYNDTDHTVDLSNWRVRGGLEFFFPANTFLPARSFLVVAEDPATLQSRFGVAAYGPWTGGLNNEGEELTLRDALNSVVDRVDYQSEFPWPVAANGNGPSAQLVNPALDNNLGSSWRSALPTPGSTNAVFAANAAPNIRQVDHSPNSPRSTNTVTVTAKVTDPQGVSSVTLAYQVVAPGNFIPATLPLTGTQLNSLNSTPATNALNPVFEASSNWVSVVMRDDGLDGDLVAGDAIYTAVLPPQANRHLVRYRITCTDSLGETRRAPFEDDPSLNFAYFVYDGLPNYGAFSAASLQTLPIYTLITRDVDMNQCAAWYAPFNNGTDQLPQTVNGARNFGRLHFNWEAAFVYDGKVYDHIKYRLRGANGRYFAGKRSFRIKFNDGALFQAYDNQGKKFPTKWREVVTGKGQSNRGGEQFALNEVVNYFLWNKVGVPAPNTLYFHFRVVRGATEEGANQYSGDFWGLNWAQEKYDANFLDAHDLPKGNLYKLVDNFVDFADELRYQGALAPTNGADFFNIENNLDGFKSTDWLNAHANYTNWYRYFAIARAVRHYDTWPSANKNGAWYFEPLYGASNSFLGRMMQLPYDGTDTWGATWNNGDDVLYNGIFASTATGGDSGFNPAMQLDYRNTVREIRALLFQPDQIHSIIDGFAGIARPVAAADLVRWSNAPAPANYLSLTFPNSPGVVGGLPAYAQDMKNFMFVGGNNAWWIDRQSIGAGGWVTILDTEANDAAIPTRPTITYVGTNDYPVNGLTFQSSAFADPQGNNTFGAMQWRVAEVIATNAVVTNTAQLRLEWDAAWTSPELASFNATVTLPEYAVEPGLRYRARVRHKDNTGRWSAWSLPAEFIATPRDTTSALRTNLVFNEIMYNPPALGALTGDEFEFVELKNIGSFDLNLSGLFFSQGITFTFTNGTTLAPGQVFLLARRPASLPLRYPGVVVNGTYSGRLDNAGETLAVSHPTAGEVLSITYGNRAPWPATADGFGYSLTRDAATGGYLASAGLYGTPGVDSSAHGPGGAVINEILSNSTLPARDFIEIQNMSSTNLDLSGWYLTDDAAFPQKFRIPNRPALLPGELVVFSEDDFNPTPGLGVSFSLSSLGDDVYLFSAEANGQLTGYSHGFSFGAAGDGETFGRVVISTGEEQFPAQSTATPGQPNSGPRIGPVVITEIQYNPEPGGFEFVEILNLTTNFVPLFDPANPTNTWRLNGLGFFFPTNFTLAPGAMVVITPTNEAAFRASHAVPALTTVLGPFTGSLQDSGERLELQRPDLPTTNGLPYVTIDEVRFNDKRPWPVAADGAGPSIQKNSGFLYGNEPTNWLAALPHPGSIGLTGVAPAITLQPLSRISVLGSNSVFTVAASGDAPLRYQWRFNGGALAGATNSTLELSNIDPARAGTYSVVVFNQAGAVLSAAAEQTVINPVSFLIQPSAQNVLPGTNVTLTSLAAGTGPLRYQWRFEGQDIPGATNASYSFTGAALEQHGNYAVRVADDFSSAQSTNAFIFVLVRPGIIVNPNSLNVPRGGTALFSCVATGAPPLYFRWLRNGHLWASNQSPVLVITNCQSNGTFRVQVVNLAATVSSVPSAGVALTVLNDFDGDGLPDSFETNYAGFSTNSAADALADFDGDGLSNRDEYYAGTDPTNALSVLKVVRAGAGLEFEAQTNRSYSVQYRLSLDSTAWQSVSNLPSATTVRTIPVSWPNPIPAEPERYFRIVTPAQP